jgi:hypothetical protein
LYERTAVNGSKGSGNRHGLFYDLLFQYLLEVTEENLSIWLAFSGSSYMRSAKHSITTAGVTKVI